MVDIILPVYNGYSELKKCLKSIDISQNDNKFKLIIINDHSSDLRVNRILFKVSALNYVIVINNTKNIGFVESVNKGMRYSKEDIILLNSDTIVTNNWIDKLIRIAYINKNIGTVTSLTNNGTIVSVPRFNKDTILDSVYDINDISNYIENLYRNNDKPYSKIPICVGHCVYIKRKVILKVGYLDYIHFGRGYGEEIDFSQRLKKYGWYNVAALNTFIYHSGSTSFKDEGKKLSMKHKDVIYKLYPSLRIILKLFTILPNKIKLLCWKIRLYRRKSNGLYKRN